jgi:hypothetical protein
MSYRIFRRKTWKRNPSWPDGYEPMAVPMDSCRTIATVETRDEAIEYCTERNDARTHHFESAFYEWTEV